MRSVFIILTYQLFNQRMLCLLLLEQLGRWRNFISGVMFGGLLTNVYIRFLDIFFIQVKGCLFCLSRMEQNRHWMVILFLR